MVTRFASINRAAGQVLLVIFICLSALMLWEAFFPAVLGRLVTPPLKNAVEISYLVLLLGPVFVSARAARRLVRQPRTRIRYGVQLLAALLWLLLLLFGLALMAVRTGL